MTERQIFEAALEYSNAAERRAYLDTVCGDNAALRASVDALLASHEAASQFLEVPVMEQWPGQAASGLDRTIARAPDSALDEEANSPLVLTFLQPSTLPGSIGRLGHYEILQLLGQGGFGVVFRAFDDKLHRHVAIKAMNPQLAATSPPRKRFLREARSVAAIKHENIVQIYSVEEQPLPFLVMEFVQGQTLQQKLEGHGPLPVHEILHLGRQMVAGLAAAHASGMIHRDIKPGNILLEEGVEQKVKITDFGLARAADDASMTRTGVIAGTPMYMSPEQAAGRALDARSDLFSFGSVLYLMCTGRPPFRAPSTMAVLRRVMEDTPRPMSEVIADIPPWLELIVGKLLAKEPHDRFQSASEVVELFTRCQRELQLRGKVTCVQDDDFPPAVLGQDSAASTRSSRAAPAARRWLVAVTALLSVLLCGIYLVPRAVERFRPAPTDHSPEVATLPIGSTVENSPDYFLRNRRAAERALAIDGEVVVEIPDPFEWRTLKPGDELPAHPFVVRIWSIKHSTKATNDDLDPLAGLRHLWQLNLIAQTPLDAEIIPKIAALRSPLKELAIGHLPLKTSDLDRLPIMSSLSVLWISAEQVDDDWRFLRRFPALRLLEVYGTPMSDLSALGEFSQLRTLHISGGEEPAQVQELQSRNPQLRVLFQVDDQWRVLGNDPARAAARSLVEAGIPVEIFDSTGQRRNWSLDLPEQVTPVTYVVTEIPRGIALTPELSTQLTHVSLQALKAEALSQADSLAQVLKDRHDIDHLVLTNSDLTDAGLRMLSSLEGLRGLYVKGTQVTAAGVASFHKAVPGCIIQSDTGDIKAE